MSIHTNVQCVPVAGKYMNMYVCKLADNRENRNDDCIVDNEIYYVHGVRRDLAPNYYHTIYIQEETK